jgi:hypothetical protein
VFKKLAVLAMSVALVGPAAFAQEGTMGRTERQASEVTRGVFGSPLTLSPQVGLLGFQDQTGDYDNRALEGLTLDWNMSNMFLPKTSNLQAGLGTGFLYSHIGSADANFFGSSPNSHIGNAGMNSFIVPGYISLGYKVSDKVLVAALPGATLLYRSDASGMNVGRGSGTNDTQVFPSIGLKAGWALAKSVGITAQGQYIPTPVKDAFSATLGATIPLA